MTNTNPLWKVLLLGGALLVGTLFALPNIFGSDPAVQVSPLDGTELTPALVNTVKNALTNAGFSDLEYREEDDRLLTLFATEDDQLRGRDAIREVTDAGVTNVALNLVSASPDWLRSFAEPMYLGLDLRGGVHFLMDIDMDAAIASSEQRYVSDWKREVRGEKIRGTNIQYRDDKLTARFRGAEDRDRMLQNFSRNAPELFFTPRDEDEFFFIDAELTEFAEAEERTGALQQNIITLRNRINAIGVAEPVIQQQGLDRIVVQLPGVQDPAEARKLLAATATLEYRLVYGGGGYVDPNAPVPTEARLYKERGSGASILLSRDVIVTGDQLKVRPLASTSKRAVRPCSSIWMGLVPEECWK